MSQAKGNVALAVDVTIIDQKAMVYVNDSRSCSMG
jgi:hypothetical protein